MNDQQIRELVKKYELVFHGFEVKKALESLLREADSITRNEVIEECAKVAEKKSKKFCGGAGGQSVLQMEANRRTGEGLKECAAAIRALAVRS